eukprot:1798151-Pyramimonas_sp.AAC.1
MLALCDAVEVILCASRRLPCTRDEIESAVLKHLELHQRAYGAKSSVFKHHMAVHLADMFERDGALSCYVQERKRKHVKGFAKDHLCKTRPEKAVMIQLTAQHMHDLQNIRGLSLECEFECATAVSKRLLSALQRPRPGTHAAASTIEAHTEH